MVQVDAHLPDVVSAEGGGHRDALRLPEGIVLHRADVRPIATWEIWKGAESGTKPSAAMKRISMPTRMVSQRRNLTRVSLREIA